MDRLFRYGSRRLHQQFGVCHTSKSSMTLDFFSDDWELYELLFSSAECFLKFFADKFSGRFAITKLQATTPEGIANSDTPEKPVQLVPLH